MDVEAEKTDVVSFEEPITLIRKVKNSLVIIQENKLILCAPFSLNRTFTGIHHARYTHKCHIDDATFILTNSEFINNPIIEESDKRNGIPSETLILIHDQKGRFYIIDPSRQITVCSFVLPFSDRIISMTGSTTLLNTFVIVTPSSVFKLEACPGVAKVIDKRATWARRILPYDESFLILSNNSLYVYRESDIETLYYNDDLTDVCVNAKRDIVVSRRDKNCISSHNFIFECISNPTSPMIGMKNTLDEMWDVADEWIAAVLSNDVIAIANIHNSAAKTVVQMNSEIEFPKYVFTGIMRSFKALGVVVFGPAAKREKEWLLEFYQIPLENLKKLSDVPSDSD